MLHVLYDVTFISHVLSVSSDSWSQPSKYRWDPFYCTTSGFRIPFLVSHVIKLWDMLTCLYNYQANNCIKSTVWMQSWSGLCFLIKGKVQMLSLTLRERTTLPAGKGVNLRIVDGISRSEVPLPPKRQLAHPKSDEEWIFSCSLTTAQGCFKIKQYIY